MLSGAVTANAFGAMIRQYPQFYEEYRDKLFRYLMYRCGNYEVARDIMQESFSRHYRHSRKGSDVSAALLFTIARNALVDYLRHERNFSLVRDYAPQQPRDIEADCITRERGRAVLEALGRLSAEDREILKLVVSGMPYRQIGEILGANEAAIKVRVHRARGRLRQTMRKGGKT